LENLTEKATKKPLPHDDEFDAPPPAIDLEKLTENARQKAPRHPEFDT
jgi:hypothetical protein